MHRNDRKQKIEELLTDLQSLRHAMALKSAGSAKGPRITPSQWGVLMHVEHAGKSTVKDVSRTLRITSSAATQLVDGLVRSGYLARKASSEDRRMVLLTLSKKSERQIVTMKQQALQKLIKVFALFSDREFEQYLALNRKLVQGFVAKRTSL
jgi:DNA-binding MarR family transcriptional regulator